MRKLSVTLLVSACESPAPPVTDAVSWTCDAEAQVRVELFGGIQETLDWQADTLTCAGMPRPEGRGARLRLSGPVGDRTVAFILGVPDLRQGDTGKELPTNVTLIEEGTGRFFATPDTSGCWTDIDSHDPVAEESVSEYRISGTLYCVSPLAELNGGSSITFTELKFASRLNWSLPK
jgi:hypothetical protein